MSECLELDDILSLNPQVDEQLLKQSRELSNKMHQYRGKKRGYNLASPYTRRRLITKENQMDPRTVLVGRSLSR